MLVLGSTVPKFPFLNKEFDMAKKSPLNLAAIQIDSQIMTGVNAGRSIAAQTILPDTADCTNYESCSQTSDCNTQENYGTCENSCGAPPNTYWCVTEWMSGAPGCDEHFTIDARCTTNACC
jgi:hypothetical protein